MLLDVLDGVEADAICESRDVSKNTLEVTTEIVASKLTTHHVSTIAQLTFVSEEPSYPIMAHGPIRLLYISFQIPSMISGVETPSASTAMTSRLIAAQIRLKMKPEDSFRAVTG